MCLEDGDDVVDCVHCLRKMVLCFTCCYLCNECCCDDKHQQQQQQPQQTVFVQQLQYVPNNPSGQWQQPPMYSSNQQGQWQNQPQPGCGGYHPQQPGVDPGYHPQQPPNNKY